MTRTRRFLGGVTLGYVYLLLVTVVGLWLTPFLLSHLGQRDLGLWMVATQLLGYMALLDFGVVTLVPRETAYAVGSHGTAGAEAVAGTIARFRRLMWWQVPVVAVAAAVVWLALPAGWGPLRDPLALVLVVFSATFALRVYHAVLQGLQDHAFLGRNQLVAWAAGTIATVVLVLAGAGLYALVVGWTATQIVSALGCRARLRRQFADLWRPAPAAVSWREAREVYARSIWLNVAQIGHIFLNGSDVLVVGALLGAEAVVPYACTTKLVAVLSNHPQLLMQTAAPALSELRAAGHRDRLVEICAALARAMLVLSGGVACLVLATNEVFVSWWVGRSLFAGWDVTAAVVAVMLVRHFNDTSVHALYAFRRERAQSLTGLADGAVTLVASLAFVHQFGLIGAPLGSLLGCLCVSLPLNLRRLAGELGVALTTPLRNLSSWSVRFGAAAAVAAAAAALTTGGSTWTLVALSAFIGLSYTLLMWPLASQPPLGSYVRAAFRPVATWVPGWVSAARTPLQ